jgi:hypothetical protein
MDASVRIKHAKNLRHLYTLLTARTSQRLDCLPACLLGSGNLELFNLNLVKFNAVSVWSRPKHAILNYFKKFSLLWAV